MNETRAREHIADAASSLFQRGLTFGASGNISLRVDDGWLITPTGTSLGAIDPARIAKLDQTGRHIGGDAPSKEVPLHLAMYSKRSRASAIVHLHSTHSVAVSCLCGLDHDSVLPALTPYYAMRVGRLALVPYFPPGDTGLAMAVAAGADKAHALLLANHGPIVAGSNLDNAVYACEELEETAKLFLLLRGNQFNPLSNGEINELGRRFPSDV